jgi:bifunctional non-homologous end joining protein LigD
VGIAAQWTPKGDPDEGYAKGHLKFELHGEKLHGEWNLVRSRSSKYGGGDKSWLLFKETDDYARLGPEGLIVDERPDSVATGRSLDEIKAAQDRVWHSNQSVAANVKGGAIRKRRAKTRREHRESRRRQGACHTGVRRSAACNPGEGSAARSRGGCTKSSTTATGCCAGSIGARRK